MLTWRIHRTLYEPLKREPLIWHSYERLFATLNHRGAPPQRPDPLRLGEVMRFVALLAFVPVINIAVVGLFFPSPFVALAANMVFSLLIVTAVSGRIAREHARRTYDLMSALPLGRIGIHWIYCTAWFEEQRRWKLPLQAIYALGLVASPFLFGAVVFPLTGERAVQFWLIDALSLCVFLVYDYLNAPVVAALLGMLIPAVTINNRNVRALALGAYALMTLASYLVGVVIALVILPTLLASLGTNFTTLIIIAPITSAIVIAFRETITRALWRILEHSLNTHGVELDLILR